VKIAAYIHPVVQALGPNFNCGWFEIVAKLLQTLRRDAGCDCMMIAGDWPYRWATETERGDILEGIRFAELDEISLYRKLNAFGRLPTALDQLAYGKGQQNEPALQAITEEVARCTRGFEPDVIISFAVQIDFLAALWPKALRLHVESGPFSRNPYPFSMFFDHLGMYGRSIIGQAGHRLRTYPATNDAVGLVSAFRSRNALALDAVDPFHAIDLRTKFDRLLLLPLQVSNYYSFNEQTHYRTQFEYLLDVLSATPRDVGVIVTEYVEWGHILKSCGSGENIAYLQRNFPNLIFFDQFRSYSSPSQFLAPRVDGVWSVSSNVGYQALLYNRVLGAPATSHLAGIAHATTFDGFFREIGSSTPINNDAILAWLLERYLVPDALLSDGRWLRDYLARRISAAGESGNPMDAFVPVADMDRLMQAWVLNAPKSRVSKFIQPLDAALADARVARADARVARADARVARADARVARQSLDAVLHSKSWRITGPLRSLSGAVRTFRDHVASMLPARNRHEPALGRPFLPAR
jgi:hypothetical protein